MYSKVFLCHNSIDSDFVIKVAKYLKKTFDDVFYYEDYQRTCDKIEKSFISRLNKKLKDFDLMLIFVGKKFSNYQIEESTAALSIAVNDDTRHIFTIFLEDNLSFPDDIFSLKTKPKYQVNQKTEAEALNVAKFVTSSLGLPLILFDGLPYNSNLAAYEKDIIEYFLDISKLKEKSLLVAPKTKEEYNLNEKTRNRLIDGFPEIWPKVTKWTDKQHVNKLYEDKIGKYRAEDANVVAAALTTMHEHCLKKKNFTFPEAGPRQTLIFPEPESDLKVGVLVSGGIAPGINAVIDGITQRHEKYADAHDYNVEIYGFKNGFQAFENLNHSYVYLKKNAAKVQNEISTTEYANEGGSIIGTSRYDNLVDIDKKRAALTNIVTQLHNLGINILYIIGGDGSMKAAHAIWNFSQDYFKENGIDSKLSVIAIPKTMDNDILWVWQTFGFLSAVEKGREVIEDLGIEVRSNPRIGVIQLFGSDSGFVVSHAVLASRTGICDVALIPEVDFTIGKLAKEIEKKIQGRNDNIPHSLVVMAETAIPLDAIDYLDDVEVGLSEPEKDAIREYDKLRKNGLHIQGQTDDLLRNAGLKIVSRGLIKNLPKRKIKEVDWKKRRVFTNEPRHLLRAIPPSSSDIIFGHRLGSLAVDNALAGYTDFMVSQWLTEYVLIPLDLVVLGRKRIPKEGIFWKSVLAKTGQDPNLID